MQHHLLVQYETAWAVADLVTAHGCHDFRSVGDEVRTVVTLCGLSVVFDGQMPMHFTAIDLDLTLVREVSAQDFGQWLKTPELHEMRRLVDDRYTLRFDRGSLGVLMEWRARLEAFATATALSEAA